MYHNYQVTIGYNSQPECTLFERFCNKISPLTHYIPWSILTSISESTSIGLSIQIRTEIQLELINVAWTKISWQLTPKVSREVYKLTVLSNSLSRLFGHFKEPSSLWKIFLICLCYTFFCSLRINYFQTLKM